MGQFNWTPPATDVPVDRKPTGWKPPETDVEVKKKVDTAASPNGSQPSFRGGSNFQSFLNPTDGSQQLTPVTDPALKQHIQESQENHKVTPQQQELLDNYSKRLSQDEKGTLLKQNEIIDRYANKDGLRENTPEEVAQEKAMDTPLGKLAKSTAYVGSQFSKGGLDIVRGGAWLLNHLNTGFSDTQLIPDDTFKGADKFTDFDITAGQKDQIENDRTLGMGATRTVGMLANMAPAILGGEAADAPKAMFALQGFGQGKQTIDKVDPDKRLNPIVRDVFVMGTGLANAALMGDAAETTFAKMPAALRGDITSHIAMEALKENGEKVLTAEGFKTLIDKGTKDFADKFYKFGTDYVQRFAKTSIDLSALNAANYTLEKGVDLTTDKPVFNANLGDLAHNISNTVLTQAPLLSAAGSVGDLSKLTPYSDFKNNVVEALVADPNKAEEVKQNITQHGQQMGWTPGEIEATNNHVDQVSQAAKKLPESIKPEKKADAVQLILSRDELKQQLTDETAKRSAMDESVAELPTQHEQYLTDKIEQANDKLREMVTGKKTTYSKGLEKDDGKFFKTTDGKQEPIEESRYNLEKLERTDNSPLKTTENEQNDEAQKGNKESPEASKESVAAEEKVNISPAGDIEHTIPGETLFNSKLNLTPAEHTEANDLLAEHGLTTKDLEDDEQERNQSSETTSPAATDAKSIQQPENDGAGNAGKTGQGEAQKSEAAAPDEDETSALDIKSVSANRQVLGKEDIEKPDRLNMDEEYRAAAKKVDNGTLNPLEIAKDVIDTRRTPTIEEFHALLYHNAQVDKAYDEAVESEDASALIALDKAKDLLHEAARNVSYNWGFMGNLLQQAVKKDFSLANLKRLFRAKSGGEIPADVEELLKQYAKDRDDALKALQEYQSKEAEREAQREITRRMRSSVRNLKGEKLDKAIGDSVANISSILKAKRGTLSMNPIPIEALPEIAKLVGYYTQKGLLKAGEVADAIFDHLKDEIDGLTKRDVIDAIAGNGYESSKKTVDQLQKDKAEIKRQAKLVARLDDIESGKVKPSLIRTKAAISEETAKLREQIKKTSVDLGLPLKNYKENLQKRLAELENKIATGDYSKKTQTRVEPDLEARKLQAQVKRAETKINELGAGLDEKREHAVKKFLDKYTEIHRLFILSRIGTLAKLTSAASGRALTAPLEEALGSINAVLPGFRKIAERSPRYSKGLNISDEVKAITQHFTGEQMKQNAQVFKEGHSDIDYLYDPKAYKEASVTGLPGRVHAMFKNSTKQAEFTRSFSHILQWEHNNGSDINSPAVQERVGQEAYKLAKRSIFMNDNMAVDLYKGVIDMAERKWGNTGTAIATFLRALMPIVKIPTNFALEAGDIATLGARSLPTIIKAVAKGAESLSPKEADFVMRMMRKGQMGLAFMTIAYLHPDSFGGYQIQGEKRDKKDLKSGDMKLFGVKIPHLLQHWPLISAMQAAATLRRTQDYYDSKGKEGGTRAGVLNGLKGMAESVPFLELPSELERALASDSGTDSFVGQLLKSQVDPGLIQEIAEQTDTKDGSFATINPDNAQKRKVDTKSGMLKAIKESVMTGIPGWREMVAERPEEPDKSTPVIKLENGTELQLSDRQVKERQKINEDFIKQHSPALTKRFTTEAKGSKSVREKLKKLEAYWKEHNIPAEKQAKYKQMLIDNFVKTHIKEQAEKHSKPIMLRKYKKADGSYAIGVNED